jgi:hypothetical protein
MIIRKRPHRFSSGAENQIGVLLCRGAVGIVLMAALIPAIVSAAECPARFEPSIPPPASIETRENPIAQGSNIDTYKRQLTKYHDDGGYMKDIAAVMKDATNHVLGRAREVGWPAVVLDIDETSLSNWDNIKADDYGFIEGGACPLQAKMACGFNDWIDKAMAPAIGPTLDFFNAVRAENVAVFFITGRRDGQRQATLWNLDRAGFKSWARVATRPDEQHGSLVPFKSGERNKIVAERYTVLANIGDQDSDLDPKDTSYGCPFKLPNPFYFIP